MWNVANVSWYIVYKSLVAILLHRRKYVRSSQNRLTSVRWSALIAGQELKNGMPNVTDELSKQKPGVGSTHNQFEERREKVA